METRAPNATHWNDGTPMTARERRRRNVPVDDGGAEVVVLLDNVTERE